jgi:hypothetical protein
VTLFARVGKLFKQVVAWFRPGGHEGHAVTPPAPPEPPPLWRQAALELERRAPPTRVESPPPDLVPLLAMDITPPPQPPPDEQQLNRAARRKADHDRRKYEKARRKHDKFVEPQGPQPIKQERDALPAAKPEPKPELVAVEDVLDDPNDRIIVDEWLEGDGEEVLYEPAEFYGEFNFRDTILEQLDRYWVYLERMRRHDPGAYGFYKTLGATLVPYAATDTFSVTPHEPHKYKAEEIERYKAQIKLSSWFKQHWPAFGCCAFGTNPREEEREQKKLDSGYYMSCPKFLYFRRVMNMPWTVQPVRGGKLYMMTVWWDRVAGVERHRYKWGRPHEFPIQISDDGERIRILKTRTRSDGDVRPWWDWRIPYAYSNWSKQYGLDAQTFLGRLFTDTARDVELAAYSMLRVEVTKGDLTAVFGLNPHRTPYFFQDRDIELTESGRKRRVFHMVRPFVDKNGVAHPTQFRGLRDFRWAGYDVHISVPGRDHFIPLEISKPLIGFDMPRPKDALSEPEVAKLIKQKMHEHATIIH